MKYCAVVEKAIHSGSNGEATAHADLLTHVGSNEHLMAGAYTYPSPG
jgi:hypothetical protein